MFLLAQISLKFLDPNFVRSDGASVGLGFAAGDVVGAGVSAFDESGAIATQATTMQSAAQAVLEISR